MSNIVEHEGKKYLRIKDKLIPIKGFDKHGRPVIECWSEEKPNGQGGTDCTVHVNCFQVGTAAQRPAG